MPFYIGPLLLVCVIRHFRLSLLNNFYCDILHLYNIVIPTQVQYNICKPEEGCMVMASRNIAGYEKTIHFVLNQLCSSLWTARFW